MLTLHCLVLSVSASLNFPPEFPLLPYSSPCLRRHPAWLVGNCTLPSPQCFLSHFQYLEKQQSLLSDFFNFPKNSKRDHYRMWRVKGNRGAVKTINFNCRDDLMFSRQRSTWRDLLKFPLLRVTSHDLISHPRALV